MNKNEALRVLLVDDNRVNQKVLSLAVGAMGYHYEVADHGLQALERYRRHPFDVVLMDIMMPVMDGLEATRAIRAYEAKEGLKPAVIIAVSANFMEEQREEWMSCGFNDIFTKPIIFDLLKQSLHKHLSK